MGRKFEKAFAWVNPGMFGQMGQVKFWTKNGQIVEQVAYCSSASSFLINEFSLTIDKNFLCPLEKKKQEITRTFFVSL